MPTPTNPAPRRPLDPEYRARRVAELMELHRQMLEHLGPSPHRALMLMATPSPVIPPEVVREVQTIIERCRRPRL